MGFSVFLIVTQPVSSLLEGNIGEYYFTIPAVNGNFCDDVPWCKTNNNSTLAVVNYSSTQLVLSQFLNSPQLASMLYINVKLYQTSGNTWFLINGSRSW